MQVSNKLIEIFKGFDIQDTKLNFIVTDLEKVLYTSANNVEYHYVNKDLSNEMRNLKS